MRPSVGRHAAVILFFILAAIAAPAWQARHVLAAQPGERTYTSSLDFDSGVLLNVNHDTPDQLQLNDIPKPFDFVNIALPSRMSVVRINVNLAVPQVVGEYASAPMGNMRNPFQPTVDRYGNVWVANRAEAGLVDRQPKGSLTRIGLLIGGTRTGEFVSPPFQYNTCVDRDDDGRIQTSFGLNNRLPWTNTDYADTAGGVSTAMDECIISYVRVDSTQVRTLAVDGNNDLWIGGSSARIHERLDGTTGFPQEGTTFDVGAGGFGGMVDRTGNLWSTGDPLALSSSQADTLRFDPSQPFAPGSNPVLLDPTRGNAALALDPVTGHIWHASNGGSLFELQTDGTVLHEYTFPAAPQPPPGHGLVVDGHSHVWLADPLNNVFWHLAPDNNHPGQHYIVGAIQGPGIVVDPSGLAIDSKGKIWVFDTGRVYRINPDPPSQTANEQGHKLGAIELPPMVLNSGPIPFNQSDATGFVAIGATTRAGMWDAVHDGGSNAMAWGTVTWTAQEPAGSRLIVEVRAADAQAALSSRTFVEAMNGVKINDVRGRYIEMRVTFLQQPGLPSPVLYDLTVRPNQQPVAACADVTTANDLGVCSAGTAPSINAGSFDPDGEPVTIQETPPPPFDVGKTKVTLTVTDGSNASDSCKAKVTVVDAEAPGIVCPAIPAVECAGGSAFLDPPGATATDNCSVAHVASPRAGQFALGTTQLTYSATDHSGNSTSCQAAVVVQDTRSPSITCPFVPPLECESGAAFFVPPAATATDSCSAVTIATPAARSFPLGTATVTYRATDRTGNAASCEAAVVVRDTRPPSIVAVTPNVTTLWPPSHKMVDVTVAVAAVDACDANAVSCSITGVTSNEAVNAKGVGKTGPDWEIVDHDTVRLRAERSGHGDGRRYTIAVACTDRAGHTTTSSADVVVPHSMGKKK